MPVDLAGLTQTAVGIAKQVGVAATVTITRPAGPPNPLTGAATTPSLAQVVPVIQSDARRASRANDAAWTTTRTALFLAAKDATFAPARADLVTFAGRTSRIEALEEFAPAGEPIGWFLGVGA